MAQFVYTMNRVGKVVPPNRHILKDISLSFFPGAKIGVLGLNGSGKSTLLKIMAGIDTDIIGEARPQPGIKIGYLAQEPQLDESKDVRGNIEEAVAEVTTALAELDAVYAAYAEPDADFDALAKKQAEIENIIQAKDGHNIERTLDIAADALRLPPWDADVSKLSGGERRRVALCKLLLEKPDMLLLDEPTNYLDVVSLRWLSNFLQNWNAGFILITHNKNFMEEVVEHTVAIHRGKMRKMKGGPTKLLEHIAKDESVYEQTRKNAIQKKAKTEEFIRNFRPGARSAGLVQSRIKSLNKQEIGTKLEYLPPIVFNFKSEYFRGNSLIELRNVCFHYENSPNKTLIEKFHLEILANECTAIVGKNGKGKSTLLDLMGGRLEKNSGHIKRYQTLKIGYFGDHLKRELHEENTIIGELMSIGGIKEQEARKMAASLLFTGNLAKKHIKFLSGGEKSRVALGKVMLGKCHLLLLDEPSNHLDMESVQALISALKTFEGSIVFVSHDEQFLHELATRLVVFEKDKIDVLEFGYQEFLNQGGWLEEQNIAPKKEKKQDSRKNSENSGEGNFLEKKEMKKMLRKAQKDQDKLEKKIFEIEKNLVEISDKFQEACASGDAEKIKEFGEKIKNYNDEKTQKILEQENLLEEEIELEEMLG